MFPPVPADYWSVGWEPHTSPLVLFCVTGNGREVEDWEQVGTAASVVWASSFFAYLVAAAAGF